MIGARIEFFAAISYSKASEHHAGNSPIWLIYIVCVSLCSGPTGPFSNWPTGTFKLSNGYQIDFLMNFWSSFFIFREVVETGGKLNWFLDKVSKTPVKVPEETAALLNVDFPDDESDQEYDPMKDPEALVKFCSEYLKYQPLPLQASYQPSLLGTERQSSNGH